MGRKLIQHGLSSLTMSLPAKWVERHGLKKGDEVEVSDLGEKIVVATQKQPEHRAVAVDISGADPMIRKILGATYKCGYDEANVTFATPEELKAAQDVVREQFIGFEIVGQSRSVLHIEDVAGKGSIEFGNCLRRFFVVLNEMAQSTLDAARKSDFNWLKTTATMKIETDKFADFCRRAINQDRPTKFKRTAPLYVIVEQLEKVADTYRDMCAHIAQNELRLSKPLLELLQELVEFQKSFYELFYKFDIKRVVELGKAKQQLDRDFDKTEQAVTKKETKVLRYLDRVQTMLFNLNGPLMAVWL